jgi:N-acylneuraminate cytidylyltransferase
VLDRPAALAADATTSEAVLLDALDRLRAAEGYDPELLVFLQCTAPLTRAADIDGTVDALLEGGADAAFAAAPFSHFLWRRADGGEAVAVGHDAAARPRRQEREPRYLEAGSVYVVRVEGFRRHRHRFFGRTVLHPVPADRLLEIDEPRDLVVAEALLGEARRLDRRERLPSPVGAVVFDFDGVMTDDRVTVSADGRESVACHRGDGLGVERLRASGLPMAVLSRERDPVVAARCAKLGLEVEQGLDDKVPRLLAWLAARGIDPAQAVYVGNDVNDLGAMAAVGCPVAPADAHPEVLRSARLVLDRPGGAGAVRELADLILERREE